MYAFFAEKVNDKGIDVYAEGQLIIREMLNPMIVGYFRATTATATRFVYAHTHTHTHTHARRERRSLSLALFFSL